MELKRQRFCFLAHLFTSVFKYFCHSETEFTRGINSLQANFLIVIVNAGTEVIEADLFMAPWMQRDSYLLMSHKSKTIERK